MNVEPCPDWHGRPQRGCHMEDYYIEDGVWESWEWHCPGCCPDLNPDPIDPDKDSA